MQFIVEFYFQVYKLLAIQLKKDLSFRTFLIWEYMPKPAFPHCDLYLEKVAEVIFCLLLIPTPKMLAQFSQANMY